MKSKITLVSLLALAAVFWCGSPVRAGSLGHVDWNALEGATNYVPGQLLVGFKSTPTDPQAAAAVEEARARLHAAVGATVLHRFTLLPCDKVRIPEGMTLREAAAQYEADPNVEYAEPNYRCYPLDTTPNDPRFGELWGMVRIRAPQAWDITTGSADVVVGVIDTGINRFHEDLAANIWINPGETGLDTNGVDRATNGRDDDANGYVDDVYGWDFYNNDNNPSDEIVGHGTHVAGTIGAVGNNALGVVGVNWRVRLMALRFLGPGGGETADAVRALEYAIRMQVRVTCNSWGGGGYSATLRRAIDRAREAGQLFVAAAGNDGSDNDSYPQYPASYGLPNIIAVAALDPSGHLSDFSNYGRESVHLAAPGRGILSCGHTANNAYREASGTSMATPHVAGAAALLWAFAPQSTWQEVRDAILDGAAYNPNLQGRVATSGELDLLGALVRVSPTRILLDRLAYRSDGTVRVTVVDRNNTLLNAPVQVQCYGTNFIDLNHRGTLISENTLTVYADESGERLTNTIPALNTFLTPPPAHDNVLVFTYTDPDIGNGNSMDVYAVVRVDDIPPVITNLRMENVSDTRAEVAWETDESADGFAVVGTVLPLDTNAWRGSAEYVSWGTNLPAYPHRVVFTELTPFTLYCCAVRSADPAGNETVIPANLLSTNRWDYLQFNTHGRVVPLWDDMEAGPAGWTHGGLNDDWEYGTPNYAGGPPAAFSGAACWGTDLGGVYNNVENAWLVSPFAAVGNMPRLDFMTWYSFASGDAGFIEVNAGEGWTNVTRFATASGASGLAGASGRWVPLRLELPTAQFGNRTLQARFRIQTDGIFSAAGWYIDDVSISYVTGPGVWVRRLVTPVDDDPGLSPFNDGDGSPEVGETVRLRFELFNADTNTHPALSAVVDCAVPGLVVFTGTNTVQYGTLAWGEAATSTPPITLVITNDPAVLPPRIPLLHSTFSTDGGRWKDIVYLDVRRREGISGVVTNFAGAAVAGATVIAECPGEATLSVTTAPTGAYRMDGLVYGKTYEVHVVKWGDYSPSEPRNVAAPAADVNFGLGRAYASVLPTNIAVRLVYQGYHAEEPITVANTNPAADLPLAAQLGTTLAIAGLQMSAPVGTNRFEVAPGDSTNFLIHFDTRGAALGIYTGTVDVTCNDVYTNLIQIPVTIAVTGGPVLTLRDVALDDAPDHDGYAEAGETVAVSPVLYNAHWLFDPGVVTGLFTFTGASGAVVTVSELDYSTNLTPLNMAMPATPAVLQIDPGLPDGTWLPCAVDVWDTNSFHWRFEFAFVISNRFYITGRVYDAVTLDPIANCPVVATGPSGAGADLTSFTGRYRVTGLPDGTYDVSAGPMPGYGMAPAVPVTLAGGDVTGVNFYLPPVQITLAPTQFVATVREGWETNGVLQVVNNSITDVVLRVRGSLVSGHLLPEEAVTPPPPEVNWASLTAEEADPHTVVVRFEDGISAAAMEAACAATGGRVVGRLDAFPAVLVEFAPGVSLAAAAEQFKTLSAVRYVEPNYRYQLHEMLDVPRRTPTDPYFIRGLLWGLDNQGQFYGTAGADIDAPEAWHLCVGDTNVIVAVVDTGIDYQHPDLVDNLWVNPGEWGTDGSLATNGVDDDGNGFIDDVYGAWFAAGTNTAMNGDPWDALGHGTTMAGIVGAVGNNAEGVVGVSWRLRLMALRVDDDLGGIQSFRAAQAIDYALTNGAAVINCSWGGPLYSRVLYEAILRAQASNVLVICSAGNAGSDNDLSPIYPACYAADNIIVVAACDNNDRLADFSNYGASSVDIAAPGVGIYTTIRHNPLALPGMDDPYGTQSGASAAAAMVSGVAALLKAAAPQATWDMVKAAILNSAVQDPQLTGRVASGGHLSAYRALRRVGAHWMDFSVREFTLRAGQSTNILVTFNAGGLLPAGFYQANIILESGMIYSNQVPVTLTVQPAPLPQWASLTMEDEVTGDGDGFAEPGETVRLYLGIRNDGSLFMPASSGTLSSPEAGVVISGAQSWPELFSGDSATSPTPTTVTFPMVTTDVVFRLAVTASGYPPWTNIWFSVPVESFLSVTGRVTDAVSGAGVPGAVVEYYGTRAGWIEANAEGYYRLDGLKPGQYIMRARAVDYAASPWKPANISVTGETLDFTVGRPDIQFVPTNLAAMAYAGFMQTNVVLATNRGDVVWEGRLFEIPPGRVALVSDGTQLAGLEPLLRSFGVECDHLARNVEVGYTYSSANLLPYDVIIADLTGADGTGRYLDQFGFERTALTELVYVYGRKLILTGRNILAQPINPELPVIVGSVSTGLQAAVRSSGVAVGGPDDPVLNGPFCTVPSGAVVQVAATRYDFARADTNAGAMALMQVGEGDKIIRRRWGAGEVIYWSGNFFGEDWKSPGVLQDIFKNLLLNLLSDDLSWLAPEVGFGETNRLPAWTGTNLAVALDARTMKPFSTNRACLFFAGDQGRSPDALLPVELRAFLPVLTAQSTNGVRRWDGRLLTGDGSVTSCLFQLIYAGPDGVINPPLPDGNVTGDDTLLYTLNQGLPYGRIGAGYERLPDLGRFLETFVHGLAAGNRVYVRAWDAPTFALAVAYGDSAPYVLQGVLGETHDFGSWFVDRVLGYPGTSLTGTGDHNGDSIPDGYCVLFGLDPRDPIRPLGNRYLGNWKVGSGPGSGALEFNTPARVAVSSNFVFVADALNNRIQVWKRDLSALVTSYGTMGTGNDQFKKPYGLAVNAAGDRLVVADTDNYRVKIHSVSTNGTITFLSAFGAEGTTNGNFRKPYAVAIGPGGKIYVADSHHSDSVCNNRIQVFNSTGRFERVIGTVGPGSSDSTFTRPLGVAVDENGMIYVADSGNHRVMCFTGAGILVWKRGMYGSGVGQFNWPWDVNVWPGGRMYVADRNNHRVQIFDTAGAPAVVTNIGVIGQQGSLTNQFNFPQGAMPARDGSRHLLYVADTYNHRVQCLWITVDGDGDGMEDLWEDLHGLNSRDPSDALVDGDGDGLLNIGEYRIGTDPQRKDSNGNGASDGWDVIHGYDPNATGGPTYQPPTVALSVDAGGRPIRVGREVRITATFSEPVASSPVPMLSLSGGATLAAMPMAPSNASTWYLVYTVQPGDVGWVHATVTGAEDLEGLSLDPDPTTVTNLFPVELALFSITDVARPPFLAWEAESGGIYRVQSTPSLLVTNWLTREVVTSLWDGTWSWTNFLPTNGVEYYRVLWENP